MQLSIIFQFSYIVEETRQMEKTTDQLQVTHKF
jgi:hypothetical protein